MSRITGNSLRLNRLSRGKLPVYVRERARGTCLEYAALANLRPARRTGHGEKLFAAQVLNLHSDRLQQRPWQDCAIVNAL
jgi:hypothetical protein